MKLLDLEGDRTAESDAGGRRARADAAGGGAGSGFCRAVIAAGQAGPEGRHGPISDAVRLLQFPSLRVPFGLLRVSLGFGLVIARPLHCTSQQLASSSPVFVAESATCARSGPGSSFLLRGNDENFQFLRFPRKKEKKKKTLGFLSTAVCLRYLSAAAADLLLAEGDWLAGRPRPRPIRLRVRPGRGAGPDGAGVRPAGARAVTDGRRRKKKSGILLLIRKDVLLLGPRTRWASRVAKRSVPMDGLNF